MRPDFGPVAEHEGSVTDVVVSRDRTASSQVHGDVGRDDDIGGAAIDCELEPDSAIDEDGNTQRSVISFEPNLFPNLGP
jgi:hypothetical protein